MCLPCILTLNWKLFAIVSILPSSKGLYAIICSCSSKILSTSFNSFFHSLGSGPSDKMTTIAWMQCMSLEGFIFSVYISEVKKVDISILLFHTDKELVQHVDVCYIKVTTNNFNWTWSNVKCVQMAILLKNNYSRYLHTYYYLAITRNWSHPNVLLYIIFFSKAAINQLIQLKIQLNVH